MNNKYVNHDSFKKQNINDFPNASIGAAPKPTQKSVQVIIEQFKERNRQKQGKATTEKNGKTRDTKKIERRKS